MSDPRTSRPQNRLRAPVRASDVLRVGQCSRRRSCRSSSNWARPTGTVRPGSTAPIIIETVPKSALEKALFMESDRMGYLLPAVDQKRLDLQRGVVQNEKRQGDNQPGGLVDYEVLGTLFPEGHPYHHDTIGSMADLDAASLADVKQWFLDKYGPNNAVIALAGDITPDEARGADDQIFRGDQARSGQHPRRGRCADAGCAKIDRHEGPRGDDADPAPLGGTRPAFGPAGAAGHWRRGAGRAEQFAARPDPGSRREDRRVSQRQRATVSPDRPVPDQRRGQTGRRPGAGRKAAG